MVLPPGLQNELLGLQASVLSKDIPKLLTDMIKKSLGTSMVNQEVVVSVTEGTSERPLEVSWLLKEKMI